MELAVATQIAVDHWRNESDEILATAIDVLQVQAREVNKRGRKR